MTNFDLEKRCRKLHIPLVGIFSKDELPIRPREGGYIINLQNSVDENGNNLPGTHWTAFYVEGNKACYFDSFGFPSPLAIREFLKPYSPVPYSDKVIQNINSGVCGSYCLYFLYFMSRHNRDLIDRFDRFLRQFSNDPTKNRELLMKYLDPL
ncbi:MAG: hypothetical protein EBU90_20320 [Proteobacteria bacterium]|nr:hypothetical protein [Pseudomonadota bacterium]NBP15944.1 hypothetical protein [bacterium]